MPLSFSLCLLVFEDGLGRFGCQCPSRVEGEAPESAPKRWKALWSAQVGCAWLEELAWLSSLSEALAGKVLWVPSPRLRLHCDTNLNQSVPKKKEKYPALLLQPFQRSFSWLWLCQIPCPGELRAVVSPVPLGRGSRLHIPAGTAVLWDYGMGIPTCFHVSPAWHFTPMLLGCHQANSRYQRTRGSGSWRQSVFVFPRAMMPGGNPMAIL